MTPIAIVVRALDNVRLGGALLGMLLRTVLPEHHFNDATKDVVKVVTGLLATLAALVLGLLVASSKNSFDTVNEGFRSLPPRSFFWIGGGAIRTGDPRNPEVLKAGFAARIEQYFPTGESGHSTLQDPQATAAMEGFQQRLRVLSPQNDAQRALQARALELSEAVTQARWSGIEHEDNSIPDAVHGRARFLACRHVRQLRPLHAAPCNCNGRNLPGSGLALCCDLSDRGTK